MPPGPPARALRPPSSFAPDDPPRAPQGPPAWHDEPEAAPAPARVAIIVEGYCWPCKAVRRFERAAPRVPRRCVACRMPLGHKRPDACAICEGPLPKHPEYLDRPSGRLLCCAWPCLIRARVRWLGSSDAEACEIAQRFQWLN